MKRLADSLQFLGGCHTPTPPVAPALGMHFGCAYTFNDDENTIVFYLVQVGRSSHFWEHFNIDDHSTGLNIVSKRSSVPF